MGKHLQCQCQNLRMHLKSNCTFSNWLSVQQQWKLWRRKWQKLGLKRFCQIKFIFYLILCTLLSSPVVDNSKIKRWSGWGWDVMCARSSSQVSKSLTWFKALKTRTFCIESSYNQEPSLNQNAFMCSGSSISIRNWVNYLKLYLTSIIINTSQIFTRAKFRTCSKTNFSKKFSHSTRFVSNKKKLWQLILYIFAGLSYINSTNYNIDSSISLKSLQNLTHGYKVRNIWFELICLNVKYWLKVGCVINVENWTKWLLGEPVYFFKYGSFLPSKHLGNMKQDHDESIQANFKITFMSKLCRVPLQRNIPKSQRSHNSSQYSNRKIHWNFRYCQHIWSLLYLKHQGQWLGDLQTTTLISSWCGASPTILTSSILILLLEWQN